MGVFKSIKDHFVRNVIKDKQGILPAIVAALPAIGKTALAFGKSGIGQAVIGGGLSKLFGGKSKGPELQDLRTEEQKAAIATLNQLGQTGSAAGINLGEAFGGSLGDFQATGAEQQGLQQLSALLGAGPSADLAKARSTFTDLADTSFDPSDPKSGFASFSRALAKSGAEAQDVLNQQAAITGGVFGSGRGRDTASLQADLANQRGSFLADLFQRGRSQQLAGAQGLAGLGELDQRQQLQQIQASQQLGSLQRDLKNQEAQANFNEFARQRSETLDRVGILQTEAGRNPLLGVSSIPGSPSPFSSMINSVLGGAGTSLGEKIGTGGLGSLFGGGKSSGITSLGRASSISNTAPFKPFIPST